MYGDPRNWVSRWKLEMKYLQRITRGDYTFYAHPTSGPVQHDDFADVTANLIHRLAMRVAPTKESIKDNRKHGGGPIQRKTTVTPITGPRLWSGAGGNSALFNRINKR